MNRGLREAAVARATPPVHAEVRAATQEQAKAAGKDCQVVESRRLGFDAQHHPIYEAACASGPGFLFVATTPPTAADCLQLASTARLTRERDPAANVGALCELPANDIVTLGATIAREAGVTCQVDDIWAISQPNDVMVYEVGCAGQDGYWIERSGETMNKTECLETAGQGETCRFTTPSEQAATLKAWLAGSPAADCDVQQARFMGGSSDGRFYEAKCAMGTGYIALMDDRRAVLRTYPCIEAQRIGGGCTLTRPTATATQ